MGVDDAVPLLLGHVEQHAFAQDPGDADCAVDAAELVHGGADDPLARIEGGDVVGDRDRRPAGRFDVRDDSVRDLTRWLAAVDADPVVVDDDGGAFSGTREGDGATDAASGAGDGDDLVLEESHGGTIPDEASDLSALLSSATGRQ